VRAVGYFAPGPIAAPNSLMDIELPRPSATGRDLLVEVRAVSVNPVDYKVRASAPPPAGTAKVVGYDAAGVVVEAARRLRSSGRATRSSMRAASSARAPTPSFISSTSVLSGTSRARSDLPRPRRCRSHRSPHGNPCSTAWTFASRWWARRPRPVRGSKPTLRSAIHLSQQRYFRCPQPGR
jgi:hypothetical protein